MTKRNLDNRRASGRYRHSNNPIHIDIGKCWCLKAHHIPNPRFPRSTPAQPVAGYRVHSGPLLILSTSFPRGHFR